MTAETGGSVSMGDTGTTQPSGGPLPDSVASLTEKPEAMVGAAFAGGLVFAMLLKRLGR